MQQDAMRRVREMQARANATVQQSNAAQQNIGAVSPHAGPRQNSPPPQAGAGWQQPPSQAHGHPHSGQNSRREEPAVPHRAPPVSQAPAPQPEPHKGLLASVTSIFDTLGIEQDHIIILLLIFLLLNDDGDKTLLLALFYLLL